MRIPVALCALSALVATGCSSSSKTGFHAVSRQVLLTASYIEAPAKDLSAQVKVSVRVQTIYSGDDVSGTSVISMPTLIVKDGGKDGMIRVISPRNPDGSEITKITSDTRPTEFGVSMEFGAKRLEDGKIHIDIAKLWMRDAKHPEEPAFEIAWKGDVIPNEESAIYSTQDIR